MLMSCFFFFQAEDGIRDIGVTGVQTCALPILRLPEDSEEMRYLRERRAALGGPMPVRRRRSSEALQVPGLDAFGAQLVPTEGRQVSTTMAFVDRKSTRLNSSHANISYAVFCLKKKKTSSRLLFSSACLSHLSLSPRSFS